jgi:hypothetical protein
MRDTEWRDAEGKVHLQTMHEAGIPKGLKAVLVERKLSKSCSSDEAIWPCFGRNFIQS